ncbi:putative methyltransferase C9orf114 homolog isoform X2 [Varroa jacobsoni]|uniref:putative methyltransferase C9orf114 homolog isoform X2 n=1 Tax=Varroa jacobsoni TaxID=62625 RepID=UPI000BF59C5E|nr:putative methyltransferase C9orf114 homolog isoform X2 [Varroa jacobsoni]
MADNSKKRQQQHLANSGYAESGSSSKRPCHEKPSADALQSLRRAKKRTISIAVCASVLEGLKGEGAKHRVIAQFARAASIFRMSEIVVIDDAYKNPGFSVSKDANLFKLILEYLDSPQYLRKALFPMCLELKSVGVCPPLDATHHVRMDDKVPYREGVVTRLTPSTAWVNIGLEQSLRIDRTIKTNAQASDEINPCDLATGYRVTVRMEDKTLVDRDAPRREAGLYWGYQTRLAMNLSSAIAESPYQRGYDLTIGTSERGDSIEAVIELGKFRHALVVFGGPKGLEYALEQDVQLRELSDPKHIFDRYLNTCPAQGSRTIRTEEAVLITLAALQRYLWC